MLLYGVPLSPFVRKTLFTLYELDVPFEQVITPPGSEEPAFREVSPLGRIPGFADDAVKMWDSSAICHYLIRGQNSALIDYATPQTLARVMAWDKYADEILAQAVFPPFIERVVKPVRMGTDADESVVAHAVNERLPPVAEYLNESLANSADTWLAGATFGYADIAVGAHLCNLLLAGVELDARRWPALDAWFKSVQQREAFQRLYREARDFRP
ncbi:MAG: glutathione S-transferase family protein [Halomonadaceae bacterium]